MSVVSVQPSDMIPQVNGTDVQRNGGLVRLEYTLTGISPLLMNALSQDVLLAIKDKKKSSKNAARPSLEDEAKSKLHLLANGQPHIPARAMMATLVNAGQFIRLDGKRQVSTASKTVLPGMLTLEDVEFPLVKPGTDSPATWQVDIQQGRNPNGGEAVCIVRPRFDEWEVRGTVEIDQTQMHVSVARELFDVAGKRIGFLEFSPRHKGTFGRFHVTHWKAVI